MSLEQRSGGHRADNTSRCPAGYQQGQQPRRHSADVNDRQGDAARKHGSPAQSEKRRTWPHGPPRADRRIYGEDGRDRQRRRGHQNADGQQTGGGDPSADEDQHKPAGGRRQPEDERDAIADGLRHRQTTHAVREHETSVRRFHISVRQEEDGEQHRHHPAATARRQAFYLVLNLRGTSANFERAFRCLLRLDFEIQALVGCLVEVGGGDGGVLVSAAAAVTDTTPADVGDAQQHGRRQL